MKKILTFLLLCCALSFSDIVLNNNAGTISLIIPRGSVRNPAYYFNLSPSGNFDYWRAVDFTVSGNINPDHIKFSIYPVDGSNVPNGSQLPISYTITNNHTTLNLLSTNQISTTKNYMIAIDIASSANVGNSQLLLSLNAIEATDGGGSPVPCFMPGTSMLKNFSISTLYSDNTISSNFQCTNNQFVTFFNFDVSPTIDFSDQLSVIINVAANHGSNLGSIVLFSLNGPTSSISLAQGLNTIQMITDATMTGPTSYNFTLAYQSDPSIADGTSLDITIASINVLGANSNTSIYTFDPLPSLNIMVVSQSAVPTDTILALKSLTLTINYFLPQGSQKNIIYHLQIYQDGSNIADQLLCDRLGFQISGTVSLNQIDFKLYEDTGGPTNLNDQNQFILSPGVVSNNRITLDIPQSLFITNPKNYYLVMNLAPTIDYGYEVIHLTLDAIEGRSNFGGIFSPVTTSITGDYLAKTFTVTALKAFYNSTPNILSFNDNSSLPIFGIHAQPFIEPSKLFTVVCNVQSNQSLDGSKLILYSNDDSNKKITADILIGDNTLTLPTADMALGTTYNYSLAYLPTGSMQAGISINFAITGVSVRGIFSNFAINAFETMPTCNLLLGGVRIDINSNIQNSIFIGGMEVPLLAFRLKSYFCTTTVNSIKLRNNADLKFLNDFSDNSRIEGVTVYRDTNTNNIWDFVDPQLLNIQRGNYVYISPNEEIVLTLNQVLTTFNDISQEKLFFINYVLAQSTETNKKALGHLTDLNYSESLFGNNHTLKSVLESSPTVDFTTGKADIFISSSNFLVSTVSILGEVLSPVLKFYVKAIENVSTLNIQISNNLVLFTGDDLGIKKITVVQDEDNNDQYSLSDILQSTIVSFSSKTTADITLKQLSNTHGDYNFLILFDIGMKIPQAQYMSDYLRININKSAATSSINIAAMFPLPKPDGLISLTENKVSLELISVTPSVLHDVITKQIYLSFRVHNDFGSAISIKDMYPQFYEQNLSSLNVSYLYEFVTTQSFPVTLASKASLDIFYIASPNQSFVPESLFVDGFLRYRYLGKNIDLRRVKAFNWESTTSGNSSTKISIPTQDIFFLEFPEYIEKVERQSFGITSNFRNGEIIENGDYLLVYFIRNGREVDLSLTQTYFNDVMLTPFSVPAVASDPDQGVLKIGPLNANQGTIKIVPYDTAKNQYPTADITFFSNNDFFVSNFLVYPTKVNPLNIQADPMKIGFLLSKPCHVDLYLFNSLGSTVWDYAQDYSDFGYKLVSFNGILNNGELLHKGLYLLKIVIHESGKKNYVKSITKFIVL
ncbi:MAG: hypothetical protein PHV30_02970 [Candidatus Margulisbacteria bacterium]|nr:hypothetical protein [Candidatus Margulisiibacteriota bacterium]